MLDLATLLRDEILASYADTSAKITIPEGLGEGLGRLLAEKDRQGLLVLDPAIECHGMRLAAAIRDMREDEGPRHYMRELEEWLARKVHFSATLQARRLAREAPGLPDDEVLRRVGTASNEALGRGDIGGDLPEQSDLVRSEWNGRSHELVLRNWSFVATDVRAVGPMRMGPVRRCLRAHSHPPFVDVEIHFPTGRLVISSEAIIPALAEKHVAMRQAASMHGLEAEIAITERIIDEDVMIALGVRSSSLSFRVGPDEFAALYRTGEDDDEHPGALLDYRHLVIADEMACREALRENWDDKTEVIDARMRAARQACKLTIAEFQVAPGRYRVRVPTCLQRTLPHDPEISGSRNPTAIHMVRVGDR